MESKHLNDAASEAGISLSFTDANGQTHDTPPDTLLRLLDAMSSHVTVKMGDAPLLPPVKIFTTGSPMSLPLGGSGEYIWQMTTESGEHHQGQGQGGEPLTLPADLPEGYHQLTVHQSHHHGACEIIVAPKRCYEPEVLANKKKLWGACVQLYTLRSEKNWGVGDFSDLQLMLAEVASRGGAFIGLNPIHALYPAHPESASPYSPSSRRWLNIIYIDVSAVEDFQNSAEAQEWWEMPTTQRALQEVRDAAWVDYATVMVLKMAALRMAWKQFLLRDEQDQQVLALEDFIAQGGDSLYYLAAYDALHAQQVKEDEMRWGWPVWPEVFHAAHSPEVKVFCEEHSDEVNFYLWLQFLSHNQFDACWKASQNLSMPIGLYRDLAVGVSQGGAETWYDRDLYCLNASVGAPPDILGPLGQNWGLPPMDPHVVMARGYLPFIELLRANMTSCGALRIDHVMSMLRLWWIPHGETADKGAYVHYPVDDLLAILALESQRHSCMVIGEDLGTVPEEIIAKLRDSGIYSYKVLYFEHDDKHFRAPEIWPAQAMAVASTHDLPTLYGYWESGDLMLGKTLGLYPDEDTLRELFHEREREKQGLLDALDQNDCLPKRVGHDAREIIMTFDLSRGMQRYIADSNSILLGLQPEDWLEMPEPVNIPGTSYQYKNWRRKLSTTLEAMFADTRINKLLKDLNQRRKKGIAS